MLEIVALAPENEMRVAERLRDSIASEWRDLGDSSTDRVRVFVGAGCFSTSTFSWKYR